jgi:hypothetical protein
VLWATYPKDTYVWGRKAEEVDRAISELVMDKLKATFSETVWNQALDNFSQSYRATRDLKLAQLTGAREVMNNLVASLETLSNRDLIKATQTRYEQAQLEHDRLNAELASLDGEARLLQGINDLRRQYGPAMDNWSHLTRDEKRVVLRAFITQIEATPQEKHGLRLRVVWKDQTADEIVVYRQATTGRLWTAQEAARLFELIDRGAAQMEIAREFPTRKWSLIRNKVWSVRGSNSIHFDRKPIKDGETYLDYRKRMENGALEDVGSVTYPEKAPRGAPMKSPQGAANSRLRRARHGKSCDGARGTAGFAPAARREEAGQRQSKCGLHPGLHRWSCVAGCLAWRGLVMFSRRLAGQS